MATSDSHPEFGVYVPNVTLAVARGASSGGGGTSPEPTLLFDGFESADMSAPNGPAPAKNTSGFTWGANNKTSVVTRNADGNVAVYNNGVIYNTNTDPNRDFTAKTGGYCLRFAYPANDEWTEQRFNLGGSYPEVWFKYWIRVPLNFSHGTTQPNNHKFFSLYMDAYSGSGDGATLFWNMWADPDGSNRISIARNEGGQQPSGGQSQHAPFIQVPEDRGRWMEIVIQAVASSANDVSDGEARLWRRWEDEASFTMLHEYNGVLLQTPDTGAASNGWHQGYVMGYANAPYAELTEWFVDDFKVSETSLLGE